MKILKIVEAIVVLIGVVLLFLKLWMIASMLLILATLIHIFPQGPEMLLKTISGYFMIGGVIALFFDWKLGVLLILLSILTAKFLVHGNRLNNEYYSGNKTNDLIE